MLKLSWISILTALVFIIIFAVPQSKAEVKVLSYFSGEERFLDQLSKARIALYHGKNDEAEKELKLAIKEIEALPKTTPKTEGKMMKVIEFEYGDGALAKNLLIPLKESHVNPDTLTHSMESVGQRGIKISEARVEFISIGNDNTHKVQKLIKKSLEHMNEKSNYMADFQLRRLQALLVDKAGEAPHMETARDNIALARAMLEKQQFDAARTAVEQARGELSEVRDEKVIKKQRVEDAKKELAAISVQISERNPQLIEKIDQKLKEWWDNLLEKEKELKVT